jgi:hypothetical protein
MRSVAAAGDRERERTVTVVHAEVQRGEGAHRQAHDVRALVTVRLRSKR